MKTKSTAWGRAATMIGAAVMVCGAAGSARAADAYTATSVPPLAGGTGTNAAGVNSAGMVVGQADDANGNLLAYAYENGVTTALPLLAGYVSAGANSVNTSGVVVGYCTPDSGPSRAVRWERVNGSWTVTDLGTLEASNAGFGWATRINDSGDIVGYSTASIPGGYHATRWSGGTKGDLGTLGFSGNLAYSQALGISNSGWVTGFAYMVLGGPEHGLSIAPGGRAEDVTPPGQFGLAQWHNVNDAGQLVGYIEGQPPAGAPGFQPAIYVGGEGYTMIPTLPGLPEGYGFDIDPNGLAVGTMFMLNAVPDPNVFRAFKYENGVTADLNDITTGLPGVMLEAKDIADNGLIAGTVDGGSAPIAVLLTPVVTPPACVPDFNHSGGLEVQDIFDFLNAWFAGDPAADVNGHGLGVDDIFDFLNAWFAGCR
ncbi:MAG TPA: GC-type dockerin domain-anchored protein [Phycisphaerales bacterium]|nr:GC-type dockerin domain-anchored protein [Phycisphaerales bacterium]